MSEPTTDATLEARARPAARKVDQLAIKSRCRLSLDNCGGFMIIDPYFNRVEAGGRFDMAAQEVIDYCEENQGTFPPND
jgi:hypothetical protein